MPVMMGSGVFAKAFTLEHAYAAQDTEGKTVKGELERIGYIGPQEPGDAAGALDVEVAWSGDNEDSGTAIGGFDVTACTQPTTTSTARSNNVIS